MQFIIKQSPQSDLIQRERERQTDRQRGRVRERQRDREKERQREKDTESRVTKKNNFLKLIFDPKKVPLATKLQGGEGPLKKGLFFGFAIGAAVWGPNPLWPKSVIFKFDITILY